MKLAENSLVKNILNDPVSNLFIKKKNYLFLVLSKN